MVPADEGRMFASLIEFIPCFLLEGSLFDSRTGLGRSRGFLEETRQEAAGVLQAGPREWVQRSGGLGRDVSGQIESEWMRAMIP